MGGNVTIHGLDANNTLDSGGRRWSPIEVDYGGRLITIDTAHARSHAGEMFHSAFKVTGVLDAGVVNVLIQTGAIPPHLSYMRASFGGGDIDLVVYEGTTVSADGTGQTENNTNRNSSNTPLTAIFLTPTITGDGTAIHTQWAVPVSTGIGQSVSGIADISAGEEWLLLPSTNYLQRATNNSGGTIDMWFEFVWYEPNAA